MSDSPDKKKTAPYISFSTFTSALDAVKNAGVPNIIDRHSFPSFSGGAVAAVLSSFRFFNLITDDGHPTQELHELANNSDARQKNIKALLERYFDSVIAIDLTRATPPQLDQAFGEEKYNVTGATRRKAQAFFIKAATFAEIPIGKLLSSKTRASSPRKPRKPKPAADNHKPQDVVNNNGGGQQDPPPNPGAIRTPIPLGLGRIAYVELPKDWQPSDLRKLIGILELSLGDDSASTGSA